MSTRTKQITHILFSAFPGWGHIRPFCIFAARLVKENENVVVTLLLTPNLLKKAQYEISAEFNGEVSDASRERIRAFSSFQSDSDDPFVVFPSLVETYPAIYQSLSQGKPISCSLTGAKFEAVPAPSVLILDLVAYPLIEATRSITGKSIPIISWITGHVSSAMQLFASDLESDANKHYGTTDGKVVKVPGLPDMYDYEFFPQEVPFEIDVSVIVKMCDAAFVTSGYAAEEIAIDAFRSWLSERNQSCYVIGPLVPPEYVHARSGATGSAESEEFLNKIIEKHGEKSVVLLSFGTVFWPKYQGYIDEVIEGLIEKNFPFIICYASPFANISDELILKINNSGIGLVSKWVPQQYILNHPATGWFITHCGHNSVMEGLGSGVPMICWPFEADQPAAAAHLSVNLKVAFELIEVRTGERGLKPLLRSGRMAQGTREAVGSEIREVIDACRGAKGKELRSNVENIKAKLDHAWQANGSSRTELRAFCEKYSLDICS
ncbi:hypothetical protein CVT25_000372 [Psilocybe cyanescens]|uniref:Glycosyltransferase family 1 protein n=1 Tax=Psilocybe cyanescens TaxID=93625 RepID=A0A409XEY9_PSICY|nr:hypothetical protein CVT25_000372 [Psilocybe cyanescens]